MRIFISYSEKNGRFAAKIASQLEDQHHAVWMARRNLVGGSSWLAEIDQQICDCDVFLVVISPQSLDSKWVEEEILLAHNRGKRIIPLLWEKRVPLPFSLQSVQAISFLHDQLGALEVLKKALGNTVRMEPSQQPDSHKPQASSLSETSQIRPLTSPPPMYRQPQIEAAASSGPALTIAMDFSAVMELFTFTIGVGDTIILGRGSDTIQPYIDTSVMDSQYANSVSRRHAIFENRNQNLYITDLGSTNGTYLNYDQLVKGRQVQLKSGDHLGFGMLEARIKFRVS